MMYNYYSYGSPHYYDYRYGEENNPFLSTSADNAIKISNIMMANGQTEYPPAYRYMTQAEIAANLQYM